jgi:hypothetical protein
MQDALMALQTDLASSIAVRYACRLEKIVRFKMQAIHIPDMDEDKHSPGSGWVHQTWENAIVQKAREDITRLIQRERFNYNSWEPKIVAGERDRVILEELRHKKYDFFIEGLLHSFESDRFFQKLDSDLYRNLPCPGLMIKNLVALDRGIQIVGTPDTISFVLSCFLKLWNTMVTRVDILICHFEPSTEKRALFENDSDLVSDIEERFLKYGKKPASIKTVKGSSEKLISFVRDHALLVSPLPTSSSYIAQMLAMSPCPILFCPESKID